MGNIDATVNTALALGWSVTPWLAVEGKAPLPLSDSQGMQYRTSITLIPWQTNSDTVELQAAGVFGDGRYMNTWYGVNSEQSARSGFAAYHAAGGFYDTDTSLTWSHQFTHAWAASVIGDILGWISTPQIARLLRSATGHLPPLRSAIPSDDSMKRRGGMRSHPWPACRADPVVSASVCADRDRDQPV